MVPEIVTGFDLVQIFMCLVNEHGNSIKQSDEFSKDQSLIDFQCFKKGLFRIAVAAMENADSKESELE